MTLDAECSLAESELRDEKKTTYQSQKMSIYKRSRHDVLLVTRL